MKRSLSKIAISLLFVFTFIGAVFSTTYPYSILTAECAAEYENDVQRNYAMEVAAIVNRERAANGLPVLKYSDELSTAANTRAKEIQTYFSHTRPDGRSCFTAVTDMGIRYRYIGENIAYGQRSPVEVMNGWMNSQGHRANILSPNVEYMGIGVAQSNGVYYWTQFFASADDLTGEIDTFDETPQTTVSTAVTSAETTTVTSTVTTSVTKPCPNYNPKLELLRELLKKYGIDLDQLLVR